MLNKTNSLDKDVEFAWQLLPKVSRSFAFVTQYLAEDKRSNIGDSVMLFYHVCRVLDTIEDSSLSSREKKFLFDRFISQLRCGDSSSKLIGDVGRLTSNEGYKELVANSGRIISAYNTLDSDSKKIISRYAKNMADGMVEFGDRPIKSLRDLNDYCFPVAGIVGYGLTDLFLKNGHLPCANEKIFDNANNFGYALQKVNIIRDFGEDYSRNMFFWPSELLADHGLDYKSVVEKRNSVNARDALREMIVDAKPNIDGAMDYLMNIPVEEEGVRLFCGVSLMLAIATLYKIRDNPEVFNPESHSSLKVPREEFMSLVNLIKLNVRDNDFFIKNYERSKPLVFSDDVYKFETAK